MRNLLHLLLGFLTVLLTFPSPSAGIETFVAKRQTLIKEIEGHVQATRHYIDKNNLNPRVMATMGKIPRHKFVPKTQVKNAYLNRPLPIGHGQTISQPFIVALMTDLLEIDSKSRVLEIGTGSGYQAAVLADLVDQVYTIEIIEPLAKRAFSRFRQLGYANIKTKSADGYHGWPEHEPFDAIIVTAAADHVPPPLLKQLKTGGRMVIPVGSRFQTQQLLLIIKAKNGSFTTRQVLPVIFVPLTGDH